MKEMKDCKKCLAFEEEEKQGHLYPYCDMYGLFLKSLDAPCESREEFNHPNYGR